MLAIIENFLEMLFVYKQSVYYRLHFASIFVVVALLVYVLQKERSLKKIEEERPVLKCSTQVPYFDFVTTKQKTTSEALEKLQESKEYKQFVQDR